MKKFRKTYLAGFSVLIGKTVGSRIVRSGHGPREIRLKKVLVKRTSRVYNVQIGKTVESRIARRVN